MPHDDVTKRSLLQRVSNRRWKRVVVFSAAWWLSALGHSALGGWHERIEFFLAVNLLGYVILLALYVCGDAILSRASIRTAYAFLGTLIVVVFAFYKGLSLVFVRLAFIIAGDTP